MVAWGQEVWDAIRPFLPLPKKEDWPVIRRATRSTWPLLLLGVVLCFLAGVAWANRANGDVAWWRYSNYRLREQALTAATFLRSSIISQQREEKRSHPTPAEEHENLELFWDTQRVNLLQMTDVLESRLRSRDQMTRMRRNPHLKILYASPQNFKDLSEIADDLDWMAHTLPHHTPVLDWLEARFWIWD